jgi:hypothetical protein
MDSSNTSKKQGGIMSQLTGLVFLIVSGLSCGSSICGEEDDQDHDGYFVASMCREPSNANGAERIECDNNPDWNPGNYPDTFCDGIDSDCDGQILLDEQDNDADGWMLCEGDCQDLDANINPGAQDTGIDRIDFNCDGVPGIDADGDGYPWNGLGALDCDDMDPTINPGASELDFSDPADYPTDHNCDKIDDYDHDLDGFVPDFIKGGSDCDDTNRMVNTDALEINGDEIDNDCDGEIDWGADTD